MHPQTQKPQNVESAETAKTAISNNAAFSRRRWQPSKVFERKDPFAVRKGGRLSDRGNKSQSRSKSRTISPKRRVNVNDEVPKKRPVTTLYLCSKLSFLNGQFKHQAYQN